MGFERGEFYFFSQLYLCNFRSPDSLACVSLPSDSSFVQEQKLLRRNRNGVWRERVALHPHKAGNIFFWEVCYQSIIYAKKKAPLRSCRIDSPCTTQLTSPRTMLFEGMAAAGVGTDSSSLLISNLALTHLPQGRMAGGDDSHPMWRMWAGQQRREGTEARFDANTPCLQSQLF